MIITKKKLNNIIEEIKKEIKEDTNLKITDLLFANNNKLYNYIFKNDKKFYKVSKEQFYKDVLDEYKNAYMNNDEFTKFIYDTYNSLKLPTRATTGSAGYDFYAPYTFALTPNQEIKIPTGIKTDMNDNDVLLVFPRSSLGFKYYERPANLIPVIDSDYFDNEKNEGHIFIKIRNDGDKTMCIDKGEAFCQGIFIEYGITKDDDVSETRVGGIGSTNGKK